MIVYARNLSPFGRRVMLWLALQETPYRQEPVIPVDHTDRLAPMNPALRVPVLELEDGTHLVESWMILDYLEHRAAPEARLIPQNAAERLADTQLMGHAQSATEKAVALVYDKNRRPEQFHYPAWIERLETQITGALGAIEARLPAAGYVGGDRPRGADVFAVVAHDFAETTNPYLLEAGYPRLAALARAANAMRPFAETHPKAS